MNVLIKPHIHLLTSHHMFDFCALCRLRSNTFSFLLNIINLNFKNIKNYLNKIFFRYVFVTVVFCCRYCDTIVVHDIATKQRYVFLVQRWFSLEKKAYSVEATVKPTESSEMNKRFGLILDNTILGFRESHTWTSIVLR